MQTIKLLGYRRKRIRPWDDHDSLATTPKAHPRKEESIVCTSFELKTPVQRTTYKMGENICKNISSIDLLSKLYKELFKLNNKKQTT